MAGNEFSTLVSMRDGLIADPNEFRDQVWEEYRERVKEKICNRCGEYFEYWIQDYRESSQPPDSYKGPERFYIMKFGLERKLIRKPGQVTDPFYHLCNKCINHLRRKERFVLPDTLKPVEREISRRRFEEAFRRIQQEARKRELAKEIRIEKEKERLEQERLKEIAEKAKQAKTKSSLPEVKGDKHEEKK